LYDLPIFLALLAVSGQTKADFTDSIFIGEVALDGTVRKVQGILPMVMEAKEKGIKRAFVPAENALEGSAVRGIEVYPVSRVQDVVDFLEGVRPLSPMEPVKFEPSSAVSDADMEDVMGQPFAKRALEIAAAGGHNAFVL